MEGKENLMTIQNYLKSIVTKTFGITDEEEIKFISNNENEEKIKSDTEQDPNLYFLQVAMVYPYSTGKINQRCTTVQDHFGIGKTPRFLIF